MNYNVAFCGKEKLVTIAKEAEKTYNSRPYKSVSLRLHPFYHNKTLFSRHINKPTRVFLTRAGFSLLDYAV